MAISASWTKDSLNGSSFEGYVVRDGIDSPSTGYRFDNLGLIYLDKNDNKRLDAEDLVIGSIVDTQTGGSGSLRQDPTQSTLYSIKDSDNSSKSAGIAVVFDTDFNSGKPVAPPPPKVTTPKSSGASSGAGSGTSSTPTGTTSGSSTSPSGATSGSSTASTGTTSGNNSLPTGTTGSTTSPNGTASSSSPTATGSTSGSSVSPIGTTSGSSNSNNTGTVIPSTWDKLQPTTPSFINDVVTYFIPTTSSAATQQLTPTGKQLDLRGFGLNYTADVTTIIKAKTTGGDVLKSPETASSSSITMLLGDKGNDIFRGGAQSDLIDGGGGNDIIKAGNGNDIITGGRGADQIWGGFGKNVFLGEKDGSVDRLFITSDQYVPNPNLDNKTGNNIDGSNADTINSLDAFDKITILGVRTQDLSFYQTASPTGSQGIGIYANGFLEAIYTAGDLSLQQIRNMTTGVVSGYADVINSN